MMDERTYILRFQEMACASQANYVKKFLKRLDMDGLKVATIPLNPSMNVTKVEFGISVDEKRYRGRIGAL